MLTGVGPALLRDIGIGQVVQQYVQRIARFDIGSCGFDSQLPQPDQLLILDLFDLQLLPRRLFGILIGDQIPSIELDLPQVLFPTNRGIDVDRVGLGRVEVVPPQPVQIRTLPPRGITGHSLGHRDGVTHQQHGDHRDNPNKSVFWHGNIPGGNRQCSGEPWHDKRSFCG